MNRLRVVLDTNVYVSGIQFGGVPGEILAQATEGVFTLCVSDAIRDELTEILRGKFQRREEQIQESCEPLWEVAHHVTPKGALAIADDPDDNRILECAVAKNSLRRKNKEDSAPSRWSGSSRTYQREAEQNLPEPASAR